MNNEQKIMKLKTVTLLAAIAQLLSILCSVVSYAKFLIRSGHWDGERLYDIAAWSVHIVAGVTLVVFLFTLVSRQKSN